MLQLDSIVSLYVVEYGWSGQLTVIDRGYGPYHYLTWIIERTVEGIASDY